MKFKEFKSGQTVYLLTIDTYSGEYDIINHWIKKYDNCYLVEDFNTKVAVIKDDMISIIGSLNMCFNTEEEAKDKFNKIVNKKIKELVQLTEGLRKLLQ